MATTPPLRHSVEVPPTPLHGAKYDNYRRSTRKSTRAARSRALETPPPNLEEPLHNSTSLGPKKRANLRSVPHTYSPPSSTQTSPRKQSSKRKMSGLDRGAQDQATNDRGSSTEPLSLDPTHDHLQHSSSHKPEIKAATSMLPTPVKTPRKNLAQPNVVNGAARVLFPVHASEDAMPTPRKKKNKRHVGFSLYCSNDEDENENPADKIQIYTDSKDKVPELDPSEDNPFYEQPENHVPPPSKPRGKKRKAAPTPEDRKEIKEAFNREEGIVYVFRGKKVFRKFPQDGDNEDEGDDSESQPSNMGPITRSSIKPRLLFPTSKQRQEREATELDDEEATTDIEDHQDRAISDHGEEEHPATPRKQTVFSPATPPTTGHATRQSTKRATEEPVDAVPYKGKKVSPFDGWARTKVGDGTTPAGGGKGKKREAEGMEKADGAKGSKRIKGSSVTGTS